ncbi:protein phosphatase CheZ [Thermodesulfobacteriota bacterium]
MGNMIMGNLDGNLERVAFYISEIGQIISRYDADLVFSNDEPQMFLAVEGDVCPVQNPINRDDIRPYFIVLNSGIAFNTSDYQVIFNVEELSNNLISGIDVSGKKHLCSLYSATCEKISQEDRDINIDDIDKKIKAGCLSQDDTDSLKDMIQKLRDGEFFELLTMEFSGKIKEVAKELIDFRKDIQERIEPDIVEIASRDIPEASNQLEGINDTLEESTMKIMDINEEQMEMANKQIKTLETMISGNGNGRPAINDFEEALQILNQQVDTLKEIESCSLKMMEPLSFQDLVGQRIQRIIKLVRSMELRIEDLIVSFGIKLKKHKEDPGKSYEDLNQDVDSFMTELKGPQRGGEGLDQAGIDDILNAL